MPANSDEIKRREEVARAAIAVAHAAIGEYNTADRLTGEKAVDDLLRLRWDLNRGQETAVRQRVPELLARHCTRGVGSWAAPRYAAHGGTLGNEYLEAILWLERKFPDRQRAVYQAFGLSDPQEWFREPWWPPPGVRISAKRYIAWLREAIPNAKADDRPAMRRVLAQRLAEQQEFEEAAQLLATNAVLPEAASLQENAINPDAVDWALLRRRVAAEKLHQMDPWSLVHARQLLAELHCKTWNCSRLSPTPWRGPAAVVTELRKLPPGILAAVLDDLQPQVLSAADRTPLIAVIRDFAEVEDAPVLISAMRTTVRTEPSGLSASQDDNNRRSAEALHRCLEIITGVDGPDGSAMQRSKFWTRWWRDNAERVVSGKLPPE